MNKIHEKNKNNWFALTEEQRPVQFPESSSAFDSQSQEHTDYTKSHDTQGVPVKKVSFCAGTASTC